MSTDRELLGKAARAAGIELLAVVPVGRDELDYMLADKRTIWNPLTDDGDALRLAVNLDLAICVDIRNGEVAIDGAGQDCIKELAAEKIVGDPYAATRRAIVRAAAAIGEQMR